MFIILITSVSWLPVPNLCKLGGSKSSRQYGELCLWTTILLFFYRKFPSDFSEFTIEIFKSRKTLKFSSQHYSFIGVSPYNDIGIYPIFWKENQTVVIFQNFWTNEHIRLRILRIMGLYKNICAIITVWWVGKFFFVFAAIPNIRVNKDCPF